MNVRVPLERWWGVNFLLDQASYPLSAPGSPGLNRKPILVVDKWRLKNQRAVHCGCLFVCLFIGLRYGRSGIGIGNQEPVQLKASSL